MKKAILLIILFMTFLMISTGQPGKRVKLYFNDVFYTKVNQFSKIEYLFVTNIPNNGEDPKEVPVIEILYDELIDLNKDSPFYFASNSAIKGYNKDNVQIIDTNDWDTVGVYPEGVSSSNVITRLEIPITFKPQKKGYFTTYFKVSYKIQGYDNYLLDSTYMYGDGFIPNVEISNFTFEPKRINSGVSKQVGKLKITSQNLSSGPFSPRIKIKAIGIDSESPDKKLFSSFRFVDEIYKFEEIDSLNIPTGISFDIEFELNTDMALTTGTKFARLVVESDAAPADENGELQYVENSYLHEFDGEFYKDNPTALNDGGYIQVEILENPQSSVEELTENDIKILNPQPINGSELNLELSEHQGTVITLSDIEGNVIQTLQAAKKQVSIDLSNLRSGVYFINISDGKSQITKKFMIER